MTAANVVLIASVRASLFFGCRLTLLPLLVGEAQHASLDDAQHEHARNGLLDLPAPATLSATSSGSNLRRQAESIVKIPRDWHSLVQMLKDPHQASSLLFSLCFEEAAILFVLVFLEATGRVSTQALRHNWTFSLAGVVSLAVALVRECSTLFLLRLMASNDAE